MRAKFAGLWLIGAASLFWVSWALMPGVGITDAALILELVGQHRNAVMFSVVAQLVSAAWYAPALVGILSQDEFRAAGSVRKAVTMLLIGVMGSAADAIYHLLAHAMTAPGMNQEAMLPVMALMQGPDLRLVLPMVLAFFIGSIWLSIALARLGAVSAWNPATYLLALGVAVGGGVAISRGMVSARIVGLSVLFLVSFAQAWIGAALIARDRGAVQ